jgi:hypothetical protein
MSTRHPLNNDTFAICTETIADPGLGHPLVFGPPTNSRIEVISVDSIFVTGNPAADRLVLFGSTDGLAYYACNPLPALVPDSDLCYIHLASGQASQDLMALNNIQTAPLPAELIVQQGHTFFIDESPITALDYFSANYIRYKRWTTD